MVSSDFTDRDGMPRVDFLLKTLGEEDGRLTLLYILKELNLFGEIKGENDLVMHNAAVGLLEDITEKTGFQLDIQLVR